MLKGLTVVSTLIINAMKNNQYIKFIAIAAIALLAACGAKKEEVNPLENMEVIPVKVAAVSSQNVSVDITATGLVTTENQALYSFKIGGVIDKVYVTDGQYFKKGQLLASLKSSEISSNVDLAKLAYDKAKRDYERVQKLYADSVATGVQLQDAKTGMDAAEKQLDIATFNSRYANIYANADGFVTKKMANEGEIIGPGLPVLVINETQGSNDWVLRLGVSDAEWAAVEEGQLATVGIDAFPDKTFTGKVSKKSLAADQNSGSFQIEVKLDLNGSKPAVGMFGKATIAGNAARQMTAIPYDALIEANGSKAFVFVPEGTNKVKKVPVVVSSFNKDKVFIASGLEGVAQIVVSNSAFLNENSIITISK